MTTIAADDFALTDPIAMRFCDTSHSAGGETGYIDYPMLAA